jgi:phage-related protein
MEEKIRKTIFYKHYFLDFYSEQPIEVQNKIDWTIMLLETIEIVPIVYFKKIKGVKGLYEIRVIHSGNIFRIFCFFDREKVVVLGNGFTKKTMKAPSNQIELAQKIMKEYFNEKE